MLERFIVEFICVTGYIEGKVSARKIVNAMISVSICNYHSKVDIADPSMYEVLLS